MAGENAKTGTNGSQSPTRRPTDLSQLVLHLHPRAVPLFKVAIEAGLVKVETSRRIERSRFEPSQVAYL